MDDPDCDSARLARTYAQFAAINGLVSNWQGVYRRQIRPALAAGATSILDVGCGGGDVLRLLARLARRDRYPVELLGIDPDPRAIAFAQAQPKDSGLRFECADLYNFSRRSDLLISNHVLHHLPNDAIGTFCEATASRARIGVVHADICRSGRALALFPLVGGWFRGSFILEDGLRSIRRSFTADELIALAPEGWQVSASPLFRLELTWNAPK
jgi:2-polyprenyl-3-methyl-5-hydroxy-6-metoxy-1,4-benzoquinol methylase